LDGFLTDFDVVSEIQGPQLRPILLIKDKRIMELPQWKLVREICPNKVKQPAPSLVPFIKGKIEFPIVDEGC
jgi:hypothetical protein